MFTPTSGPVSDFEQKRYPKGHPQGGKFMPAVGAKGGTAKKRRTQSQKLHDKVKGDREKGRAAKKKANERAAKKGSIERQAKMRRTERVQKKNYRDILKERHANMKKIAQPKDLSPRLYQALEKRRAVGNLKVPKSRLSHAPAGIQSYFLKGLATGALKTVVVAGAVVIVAATL
jgi:hypothetical protein